MCENTSAVSQIPARQYQIRFFGNGVALAMPFPRFVSRSTGTQEVFPHRQICCSYQIMNCRADVRD